MTRLVRVRRSPTGRRIGESHPRVRAPAEDVRLARALHDEGLGYGEIGKKLEVSRYTVRNWCTEERRVYD